MTTIQVDKNTLDALKNAKKYPRQSYNSLIKEMLEVYQNVMKHNQYDEFLHKVQQMKMKELWDNDEDGAWEDA